MKGALLASVVPIVTAQAAADIGDYQIRGYGATEATAFIESGAYERQENFDLSVSGEAEINWQWNGGKDQFTLKPFARHDHEDKERSKFDLREAAWLHLGDKWEARFGVSKVFWGFTESNHLVDIINQTDLVEDINLEEKLGQPMVNLTLHKEWGTLDAFVLPYFRDRTYPGEAGRFRGPVPVNTEEAEYESSSEEWHTDFALRLNRYVGEADIAVAYFQGTGREPYLMPVIEGQVADLIPFYPQIKQASIEAEYLAGDWTWKLESLYRKDTFHDYFAAVGGFEYTFYDVKVTGMDIGVLMEFHYDGRGDEAQTIYQNDSFLGGRLELNDVDATRVLGGVVIDNEYGSEYWTLEASRRLGEYTRVNLDFQWITSADERDDKLYSLRKDSFIRLEVKRFF